MESKELLEDYPELNINNFSLDDVSNLMYWSGMAYDHIKNQPKHPSGGLVELDNTSDLIFLHLLNCLPNTNKELLLEISISLDRHIRQCFGQREIKLPMKFNTNYNDLYSDLGQSYNKGYNQAIDDIKNLNTDTKDN